MTATAARRRGRTITLIRRPTTSANWAVGVLLFQFACQIALLSPAFAGARVFFRSASFATSLGMLFFLPGTGKRHPATALMIASLFIVAANFFHPATNNQTAGLAHVLFYIAIGAPLFWVTRMEITLTDFRNLLFALWGFHTLSSFFGALQVYFPGQYQPALASVITEDRYAALQITLAGGEKVFRPMGLTDTPGGAGMAGFYATLLGLGMLMERRGTLIRLLALLSMILGVFVLYLCQVRALLVMLIICFAAMGVTLIVQGRAGRALTMAGIIALVAFLAFGFALSVGGESAFDRIRMLGEGDPTEVYSNNRGIFLAHTFGDLLPEYPLGAGLGRWGMVASYFADALDAERMPIPAEIQWTGWLLDGGIPLMITYWLAVLIALYFAFRIATLRSSGAMQSLSMWALLLVGYDLGAVALTFSYPVFMSSTGQEFWLINAAFFGAASTPRLASEA